MPENLQALHTVEWEKLFAICEDGVCLIWAPRAQHIEGLLALPGRTERQQYLVEHRSEIVDDVLFIGPRFQERGGRQWRSRRFPH